MDNQIKKQYSRVFDENGEVELCGREECAKLISLLEQANKDTDFGSTKTGIMNVVNVKKYINSNK